VNLLKEGIIYKNERMWRDTSLPYLLCFGEGSWDPDISPSNAIFASETTQYRIPIVQDDIVLGWDDLTNKDSVVITKEFVPIGDIRFNRIFIIHGGKSTVKFLCQFTGFNSISISGNTFVLGDRLTYRGELYEIVDVDGDSLLLEGSTPLPNSGFDHMGDASGRLLVGVVCPDVYLFKKETPVTIELRGTTR
jgi:hypothetical protein